MFLTRTCHCQLFAYAIPSAWNDLFSNIPFFDYCSLFGFQIEDRRREKIMLRRKRKKRISCKEKFENYKINKIIRQHKQNVCICSLQQRYINSRTVDCLMGLLYSLAFLKSVSSMLFLEKRLLFLIPVLLQFEPRHLLLNKASR